MIDVSPLQGGEVSMRFMKQGEWSDPVQDQRPHTMFGAITPIVSYNWNIEAVDLWSQLSIVAYILVRERPITEKNAENCGIQPKCCT